jgi:hypothetical protein
MKSSGELEINNFNATSQALADELKAVSQQWKLSHMKARSDESRDDE